MSIFVVKKHFIEPKFRLDLEKYTPICKEYILPVYYLNMHEQLCNIWLFINYYF